MNTNTLTTVGYLSFGAGGLGGVWLFLKEAAYAGSNPGTELAGVLQVVGVVLVALAIGGLVSVTFLKRLASTRA
jgi:hypothetical protein